MRALVDEKRRWWTRTVHLTDSPPDVGRLDAAIESLGDDERMLTALRRLTARQRAAVVLRHVEGLSVPEVADVTGLSPTNVKAATREGLALLRQALAPTTTHDEEYAR